MLHLPINLSIIIMSGHTYRQLSQEEIQSLAARGCSAQDWSRILVADPFDVMRIHDAHFSGDIRIGMLLGEFTLPGGFVKQNGIRHATLHDVTVGDGCCIENVQNYIARYDIGDHCFIENVDIIVCEGESTFGNGVEVSVLSETGGREVTIFDRLSSQEAYVMALYRHRPELIGNMKKMIAGYCESVRSSRGTIGDHVTIADTGYIRNVRIGDWAQIEGTARLKDGSINSFKASPVHIGVNVIGDEFIISSGSKVEDGVTFSRCFIGQNCKLGHTYTASDSLFFSNCQGENGEACAVFAGPFTVTHHKSTLLIAGLFSFMNAGSGSNQSNHMYKLGPIHQGILERGAKTSSDSYILWPAKVGAFSLVMGRHVNHQDTSDLPFSYLIEKQNMTYIAPGANLKSVGTIRDARKWPRRDARPLEGRLDCINYNLLSPHTVGGMFSAVKVLKNLQSVAGTTSETYSYQSGLIKRSSLEKGLIYYGYAIDKFLGNSFISRLEKSDFHNVEEMRAALQPTESIGTGKWIDLSGLIAPKSAVSALMDDVQNGVITDIDEMAAEFARMHSLYYEYEWTWAYQAIEDYYGMDLTAITIEQAKDLVNKWIGSVLALDQLVYNDASKEFSLSAMTSFGTDGADESVRYKDFEQVRGASFEEDPFVKSVVEHMAVKRALAVSITAKIDGAAQ